MFCWQHLTTCEIQKYPTCEVRVQLCRLEWGTRGISCCSECECGEVSVSTWRGRPERQWVLLQCSSAGGWETEQEWTLSLSLSYSRLHHRCSERNSSEAAPQKQKLHTTLYTQNVLILKNTFCLCGNWPWWARCGSTRTGWWVTCLSLNYDSTQSSDNQCPSQTTPPTVQHHTHTSTDQIH